MSLLVRYRPPVWLIFLVPFAFFIACDRDAPEGITPPSVLRFSMLVCDPSMTAAQCTTLQRAISHLINHSDPFCRQLGQNAFRRNSAAKYLYQYEWYGTTIQAWDAGYGDDGTVWISSHGFAGEGGTNVSGLSAHEEYHLEFPDDVGNAGEDHAAEWEAYCGAGFVNNP